MEEYYQSLIACGERYKQMLSAQIDDNDYWGWNVDLYSWSDTQKLLAFIKEFMQGCEDRLPLMKLNRWVGYIQGSLIQWKLTTVEAEREWTRPLFRHLDFIE